MGKWNYPFPSPQADRVGRLDLWRLGWRLWSSLLRGGNGVTRGHARPFRRSLQA
jgi:hypothetical protein